MKVLGSRVIVRPITKTQTESGILIADTGQEKATEGVVLAVGPGREFESGRLSSMPVAVDDHVLFSKYGGTEIKFKGEDLIVLDIDSIQVVL